MKRLLVLFTFGMILAITAGCSDLSSTSNEETADISSKNSDNTNYEKDFTDAELKTVYFAGGCFWGVEAFFEEIPGVYNGTSGYANGDGENPTYREVMKGDKEFAETVEITYDSKQVDLEELLDYYFMVVDPISVNQQGNDVGVQYRSGIYYKNNEDQPIIEKRVEQEQKKYDEPIATEVEPLQNYYLAEEAHQDYLAKNPNGYCHIDMNVLDDIQD